MMKVNVHVSLFKTETLTAGNGSHFMLIYDCAQWGNSLHITSFKQGVSLESHMTCSAECSPQLDQVHMSRRNHWTHYVKCTLTVCRVSCAIILLDERTLHSLYHMEVWWVEFYLFCAAFVRSVTLVTASKLNVVFVCFVHYYKKTETSTGQSDRYVLEYALVTWAFI